MLWGWKEVRAQITVQTCKGTITLSLSNQGPKSETIWQAANNPGESWSPLRINSWSRCLTEQSEMRGYWVCRWHKASGAVDTVEWKDAIQRDWTGLGSEPTNLIFTSHSAEVTWGCRKHQVKSRITDIEARERHCSIQRLFKVCKDRVKFSSCFECWQNVTHAWVMPMVTLLEINASSLFRP